LVVATTQRAAPAVSATLTQSAVQQAKAGQRADLLTLRDNVPFTDKRNRLVGPPPTFEVNLLQHIRELRNAPPEVAAPETASDGSVPDADLAAEPDPIQSDTGATPSPVNAAYGQLQRADASENDAETVDARF
jgi:hypothetical protein